MSKKISIMNVSEEELSKFCEENNFPKFHASQVLNWIYKKYAITFDDMSNIPKNLRTLLDENYFIHNSKIETISEDEYGTQKLLISLYDKKKIESVILNKKDRVTFCLSSQVGCGYGCAFCATGNMGLSRNLTADEILAEFILMRAVTKKVNSIVFMGMGEPLANTKNLFKAIETINSFKGFNLGIRHITISTSGGIEVNKNCSYINAEAELQDEDSIFHYYQKLIALRKKYDVIAYGDLKPLDEKNPSVFAYEREYQGEKVMVICNFYGKEVTWDSEADLGEYQCVLSNYKEHTVEDSRIELKPYEAVVLYRK